MPAIAVAAATLNAQNTFTPALVQAVAPTFNISISGTWAGTLTLQRMLDGTNWYDVQTFTGNIESEWPTRGDHVQWRLGFKTGNYTSGSAVLRLDQ